MSCVVRERREEHDCTASSFYSASLFGSVVLPPQQGKMLAITLSFFKDIF